MERGRQRERRDADKEFQEKVVHINRVAKVVKGGRRFSFSALVVVGDQAGRVGSALGKANEVPEAIRKATEKAKKAMIEVPLLHGNIPHGVSGRFGASTVMMLPASEGTGVIAGSVVRAVMDMVGVRNVLTKCQGSRNPHNVIRATFDGLRQLCSPADVARRRGLSEATIVERMTSPGWKQNLAEGV